VVDFGRLPLRVVPFVSDACHFEVFFLCFSSRDAIPTPPCGVHHSLQKKKLGSVSEKDENLFQA
jgi:hypothetical protein